MAARIFFFFFLLFRFSISTNTLNPNQTIEDGQTLLSPGGIFALGFFSPRNSKNRYVGIWYNKGSDKAVVWVANRETPVSNSSGILSITAGNLMLIDGRDQSLVWSTNVSTVTTNNYSSTATLKDSGNLVLKDDRGNTIWESFDHPSHVMLPEMKLGLDRRRGLKWSLTSWKSAEDPARGEFSLGLNVEGMPQFFLMNGSSNRMYRSGPWVGERFSGEMNVSSKWRIRYVDNEDEIYSIYTPYDTTMLSRLELDESGVLQRLILNDKSPQWHLANTVPRDRCDNYARCGPYGSCDPTHLPESECECLQGFKPRSARDWQVGDWTDGCMRREPFDCGKGDGFLRLAHVKLPDTSRSVVEPRLSLQECKIFCLKNCSCTAYASADISGEGSGCVMWGGDLIDLKVYSNGGQEMYTRVAASELDKKPDKHSRGFPGMKKLVVTTSIVTSVVLAFITCGYCWWKKVTGRKVNKRCDIGFNQNDFEDIGKSSKLSLFQLKIIAASTNNFSEANMLGRGGFGAVYKGKLLNGQEIAVKRLSMNSGQGIEEFEAEVLLIAKLQHKNLVRLLGCCIEGEEKTLVYEYMENKSLDSFIFDETRRAMLDWRKRFTIIMGIARGVLYLHEDSRLRIIHRDLKVSNVLLDEEMNPKISDFGLARIFDGNQTQVKTKRVVGTYGYMSPEYAMNGLFSIKSDVFSFGIILLEIISGKRNNCCDDCHSTTLIGYAWELWKEGKTLELVDSLISDSCCQIEVSRCIEVGLLCVQESVKDRPNMSSVVFMLGNEVKVPSPKKPAFFPQKEESYNHVHSSVNGIRCGSKNEVTITEVEAR